MPTARRLMFKTTGQVFAHPTLFRMAEHIGGRVLPLVPEALTYSKMNPWTAGNDRAMIEISKTTFRDWYLKNRGGKKDE